ncbi:MAG: hypothetical protein ACRDO8_03110 [Nocardioidaceae bacterium]
MALIALASAKGSPGVTTAALLLGGLWPRPVLLAECDPAGSDVALRIPAPDGNPLDTHDGLLGLVAAGRKKMHPELVLQHSQQIVGGLEVLTGVTVPEQAAGLGQQWGQLGPLFNEVEDHDVIADLGRIGAATPQNALLGSAHAIVMVVDTVPSNVVHLRERLGYVQAQVGGALGTPIHVLAVAEPRRTQAVRELRDALERAEVTVAGVHHVAYDVRGANVFQGQIKGNPRRTALVRSGIPVAQTLAETTAGFLRTPVEQEVAP